MPVIRYGKMGLFNQVPLNFLGLADTLGQEDRAALLKKRRERAPSTQLPASTASKEKREELLKKRREGEPSTLLPSPTPLEERRETIKKRWEVAPSTPLQPTVLSTPLQEMERVEILKKRRMQGTPSYVPPPTETPTEINPEDSGLYPEGSMPPQIVYVGGGGGVEATTAEAVVEEPIAEVPPIDEPKKPTTWLLWLAVAASVYLLFGEEIV